MTLQEWIDKEKIDSPELSDFLGKIRSFFGATGFNASEFERKIDAGIKKAETDIENSLKLTPNANG